MKICSNHEKQIPLISTMAFSGSEWWCPYCGYKGGFFGAGINVEETDELLKLLEHYLEKSNDYLRACGRRYAVKTLYNGEWMDPADLPEEEKERDRKIIEDWTYDIEKEL